MIKKLILLIFIIGTFVGCKSGNTEDWIRGAGAPFVLSRNKSNINIFTGFKVNEKNKSITKLELSNIWKIKTKEDVENLIKSLLSESRREIVFKEATENIKVDKFKNEFKTYYETSGKKASIAWDYARAMHIAGISYLAGYYSKEEALDKSLEISKLIQKDFSSWDEYNESFLEGFENTTNNKEATKLLKTRIDNLKKSPTSPYKIQWNMVLEKNW